MRDVVVENAQMRAVIWDRWGRSNLNVLAKVLNLTRCDDSRDVEIYRRKEESTRDEM